jgi:poly-gamma-glutamate system protein
MKRSGDPIALAVVLGIALLWYGVLLAWSGGAEPTSLAEERQAARSMEQALQILAQEATTRGFPPDPATDPNRTGLIGLPFSPLTTTLGSLPSKRTGAQPAAAALMVRLLREAGVHPGDRVVLDSSGSFPGFAIATLVALKTLGAEPITLASIGASTYGANRPDFTLPDMLHVLVQRGLLPKGPLAVSPGGASDAGKDMDAAALEAALERARSRGSQVLRPTDLAAGTAAKRALLGTPRVLVSVGGNWTSAGPGESLQGRTGLLKPAEFGPHGPSGTGLIQACLREGIPVIRILDVQDLCVRTGLPFDPIPWTMEGLEKRPHPHPLLVGLGPVLALASGFLVRRRREQDRRPEPGTGLM